MQHTSLQGNPSISNLMAATKTTPSSPNNSFDKIRSIYDRLLRFPLVESELMDSIFLTFRISEDTVDNWAIFHKDETLLHMLITVKNTPETIERRGGNLQQLINNIHDITKLLQKKSDEVPPGEYNPFLHVLQAKSCHNLTFEELNAQMEHTKATQEPDLPEKNKIAEYKNLGADQRRETPLHVLARQVASQLRENPERSCNTEMSQIFNLIVIANKYEVEGGKEFLEAKDIDGKKFYEYIENPSFRGSISFWKALDKINPKHQRYEEFFSGLLTSEPKAMVRALSDKIVLRFFTTQVLPQTHDNILHAAARYFARNEITLDQLKCLIDTLGRYDYLTQGKNYSGFVFFEIPELKQEQRRTILALLNDNQGSALKTNQQRDRLSIPEPDFGPPKPLFTKPNTVPQKRPSLNQARKQTLPKKRKTSSAEIDLTLSSTEQLS